MNRIPYCIPPPAYSTCGLDVFDLLSNQLLPTWDAALSFVVFVPLLCCVGLFLSCVCVWPPFGRTRAQPQNGTNHGRGCGLLRETGHA